MPRSSTSMPETDDFRELFQGILGLDWGNVDRAEKIRLLEHLLTPSVCRRLGLYTIPRGFLLSVVVPVFNERSTLERLVQRVQEVPLPLEIILVDDGSTDGTRELLTSWLASGAAVPDRAESDPAADSSSKKSNVRILFHDRNQGKGAALRTGLKAMRGDVVVFQDADLEYDPHEYPLLLLPILEDQADVVYGSRFSSRSRRVPYYWHSTVNRLITLLSNMSTNLKLTDVETCYKMIRASTAQRIVPLLREQGFGIEIEITARLARLPGIRFHERPISYAPRTHTEGKKIRWHDGLRALWCILRY